MSLNYNSSFTKGARASKVLNFVSLPDKFICIGKPTEWSSPNSDTLIPSPDENSSVLDPVCYIKPYIVAPVYRSPCGSVEANGGRWTIVDQKDIRFENSRVVPPISDLYVQARIDSSQYNTDSFRIIALYTHTKLIASANPNLTSYEPVFISNPGIMHWIAYSTPIFRLENKSHVLDLILPL